MCSWQFITTAKYEVQVSVMLSSPGQEVSLSPRFSKLRSFGSICTVLKKVLVTLLGLFGYPRSDSAPRELCPPFSPRYTPACCEATSPDITLYGNDAKSTEYCREVVFCYVL